jgi:hypothetical protein
MRISRVSLTLPWPCRLCLLRVLLSATATATSFPLSKHTLGGDTAPAFSGLRVYLQFTCEVGLLPSPVEFSSHCQFYKLSHSRLLACAPAPTAASTARLGLFTVSGRIPLPHSSGLRAPHPHCQVFLLFLLLITQFLFFSLVWVRLSRALC